MPNHPASLPDEDIPLITHSPKMAYIQLILLRVIFVVLCWLLSSIALIVSLLYLPIRILRALFSSPDPQASPSNVRIIDHPPTNSTETRRATLLFFHGFPDCSAIFDNNVAYFTAQGYRCLVVAMPGSRSESYRNPMSPEEVIDQVYNAVNQIHTGPLTVIGHDWGSFYVQVLHAKYPALCRRLITLDVGRFEKQDISVWIAILSYQMMLAFCFIVGHPGGTIGVKGFLILTSYNVRPLTEVTADMCAPYFTVFRAKFQQATGGRPMVPEPVDGDKKGPIPKLFLYGKNKNFHFHDEKYLQGVRNSPGGEVVGLPCGHWISVDQEKECDTIIDRWLEKTSDAVSQD